MFLVHLRIGPLRAISRPLPALVSCQGNGPLTSVATFNCTSASSWVLSDVQTSCASTCNWHMPGVRATQGRPMTRGTLWLGEGVGAWGWGEEHNILQDGAFGLSFISSFMVFWIYLQ